jgi:hypothetical protein
LGFVSGWGGGPPPVTLGITSVVSVVRCAALAPLLRSTATGEEASVLYFTHLYARWHEDRFYVVTFIRVCR